MKPFRYPTLDSKLEEGKYEGLTILELLIADFKVFRELLLDGEIRLTKLNENTLRSFDNILVTPEEIEEMLSEYYERKGQEMEERDYRQQNDVYDTPYYDDRLDLDQQSPDFWNEIS